MEPDLFCALHWLVIHWIKMHEAVYSLISFYNLFLRDLGCNEGKIALTF